MANTKPVPPPNTVPQPDAPRRVGRPRSEATRNQILSTTIRLLRTHSVQAITIEAIAREAQVGKATIYRWWNSKVMVVIDAFVEHHVAKTPFARGLPAGDALALHFRSLVREYAGWSGRIVAQIIAEGQSDPEALREFRERFQKGRRALICDLLEAWRQEAGIPAPANIELLGDLLYAPVYNRLMLGHGPLDDAFVHEHLHYVYSLVGATLPEVIRQMAPPADRIT